MGLSLSELPLAFASIILAFFPAPIRLHPASLPSRAIRVKPSFPERPSLPRVLIVIPSLSERSVVSIIRQVIVVESSSRVLLVSSVKAPSFIFVPGAAFPPVIPIAPWPLIAVRPIVRPSLIPSDCQQRERFRRPECARVRRLFILQARPTLPNAGETGNVGAMDR